MKILLIAFIMSLCINSCMGTRTNTNIFTHKVGNIEVHLLSEGKQDGNIGILIGATSEMLQKTIPDGTFTLETNIFLVRSSGKNILIDTGHGRNLFDNLQFLGIRAKKIDAVLLTHMHGDHIGGLLRNGKASFPNAILYVSQLEYDYWTSDEEMNKAVTQDRFQTARNVIDVYKDRLHLFNPNEIDSKDNNMLFPGIHGIAIYGHTPGHTAFMVNDDKHQLLFWGDLTHVMPVQMPYPKVSLIFDVDPEQAIATRMKILEYVSRNNIPVAGAHIPFPGMGHLEDFEDGYVFTPLK